MSDLEKDQEISEDAVENTETTEDVSQDTKQDEKKDEKKEEKPGIIDTIKSILSGKKKSEITEKSDEEKVSTEKADSSKGSEAEADDEQGQVEISPPFVAAARSKGWSDEEIVKFAEGHSDSDITLLTNLLSEKEKKEEAAVEDKTEEPKPIIDSTVLESVKTDEGKLLVEKVIKPLLAKVEELSGSMGKVSENVGNLAKDRSEEAALNRVGYANDFFDSLGIPALGATKDILGLDESGRNKSPEFLIRGKLWDRANRLASTGMPFAEALKDSIQWYKGGVSTEMVKKDVLDKIKKGEKRLFPRRKAAHTVKTFASERERKADIVNSALRKHGRELPE